MNEIEYNPCHTLCSDWTSHDDITGDGQETFYHECGRAESHVGHHKCFGHQDEFTREWSVCDVEWRKRGT